MHQIPKGKFLHDVDQQSTGIYAVTVTVVLAIISALPFTVLLFLMRSRHTNEIAVPIGCLNEASIHNFVLTHSSDLFQYVLRATDQALLVAASLGLWYVRQTKDGYR